MIYWFFGKPGSGKTYASTVFSKMTGLPRFDGDDFHTAADRKAIDEGKFTVKHRQAQLARITAFIKKRGHQNAIVAHSLPDQASRELLLKKSFGRDVLVLVDTPRTLHIKRLARRKNHDFTLELLPAWIKKHWQHPKRKKYFVLNNGGSAALLKKQLSRIYKIKAK